MLSAITVSAQSGYALPPTKPSCAITLSATTTIVNQRAQPWRETGEDEQEPPDQEHPPPGGQVDDEGSGPGRHEGR